MNLMENARQQAAAIVAAAYDKAVAAGELPRAELPAVTVETPKDAANGDWASAVAMQCARPLRMAPRKIAEALVNNMELGGTCFDKVEIAGPGFMNFTYGGAWYQDAARFFFNSRAAETQMEFDLDLAVKQDSDNPLYYIQYAHARICSVLKGAEEAGIALPDAASVDLTILTHEEEKALIKAIAQLPEEILMAARDRDPSRLNKYGVVLASQFHRFYNACRIKDAEPALRDARLALCMAAVQTIRNVLVIIGVDAPEHM